jgi:hypothetical protein
MYFKTAFAITRFHRRFKPDFHRRIKEAAD